MTRSKRATVGRRISVALFGLGVLAVAGGGFGLSAMAAPSDDGIGLTVTVAPSPSGSDSGTGGGGGGTTPVDSESPSPSPSGGSTPPNSGDGGLGGIVFVSGLTSHYVWSSSPVDSRVLLTFTVRNDAMSTIRSTARFWATSSVGNRIGTERTIDIRSLRPNETRVIQTSLSGFGQWTAIHTHVKFTPPKLVDGKKLTPVTRDSFVVVPPIVAVGCGGAIAVIALLGIRFAWFARLILIFRGLG